MQLLKKLKEVVVDIEKEYDVSESIREAPLQPLLIFPLHLKKNEPDLLISYVNQSLRTALDGMMELDGFSFGIEAPEGLQPKRT